MWTLSVVVRGVHAQHRLEVAVAEDQQPVETLGTDAADETLGVGVRLWCADRGLDHGKSFAAENLVEGAAEFTVAVVDQEAHPLEHSSEAEVTRLLGHPGAARV